MRELKCKLGFLLFLVSLISSAQVPVANFTLPASACISERFEITNNSVGNRYEWDFCQGDLLLNPAANIGPTATGNTTLGIDVVFDGTAWFGFVTDAANNTIVRLSYGSDLNSTPTVTSLGSIFSASVTPYDIKVVYHQGEWFGFVYGVGQLITRLDFGNSLTNVPSDHLVLAGSGTTSGLDVVYEAGKWYIVFTQFHIVTVIELADIRDTPAGPNIKTTSLSDTNVRLGDIKVFKSNNNWYGYSVSYQTKKLFKLDFGANLFSIATETQISSSIIDSFTPFGIDGALDNGNYVLFISTLEGSLIRINLGANLSQPPIQEDNLGTFSLLNSTLKVILIKTGTTWKGFSISYTTGNVFNIDFPNPGCDGSQTVSQLEEPEIAYSNTGTKHITLRSFVGGAYSEMSKSVTVQNLTAPVINILSDGNCETSPVQFNYSTDQSAVSVAWEFPGGSTSTNPSPAFLFSGAGTYQVTLKLNATNGCSNLTHSEIQIYSAPTADFAVPGGFTCTNSEFTFSNATVDYFDGLLTYQWLVDGSIVSTERDLRYAFSSIGNKNVELISSIPGCASPVTKPFMVSEVGPSVEFTMVGVCQNDATQFTSITAGEINSLVWNFGDGQSSSAPTTTHTYSTIGDYSVSLTVTNSVGCQNSETKPLTIYSKPQVNFLLSPPPFSCNGTASQFNDLTPNPSDSNINGWSWNFGDSGSGQNTSAIKNPQHTYANAGGYTVSLTVTTNFLCSATLQSPVTISQTPTANFSSAPTCEDVPVNFAGTSTATITAWNWIIGSTAYFIQNPTHTFVNPGNTSATLNVTASNGCVGSITKPIVVPVKLTPDFSVARNCVNQQTTFTDITNGTADPVSLRHWTFGTMGTANGSPVNFTFPSIGNVNVQLTTTTQTGCIYSTSKLVNIIASPLASFTASPSVGEAPLNVQFTNTSVNATSYQWAFHDQNNSTSTVVSPTFIYQNLGEYQPELTAFNAQNCSQKTSRTISVVIPVMNVALNGLELMELQNGLKPAVIIFNHGNTPLTSPSLLLSIAGQVIRERVTATINPGTSYRYVFSFEFPTSTNADYFCVETEVDDTTPFDDEVCLSLEQSFITFPPYPNPAYGSIRLDWIAHEPGIVNLTIVNSMGQEQQSLQIESIEGLNPITITTAGLSSGIYFVKIKYKEITKVYKVLVSE